MRRKLLALLIMLTVVVFAGCKGITGVTRPEESKRKPTEAGAKAFERKWQQLSAARDYAGQYELLTPDNKKLISKDDYVRKNKERAQQESGVVPKVNVEGVEIQGDKAKVTISVDTPFGKVSHVDEIVFIDGKWYQKLEPDFLLTLGVSPSKISSIKNASVGQQFAIPAFAAVISNPRADKTATGEYGDRETAQGKFVIVDASITNTGKQPFRVDVSENFRLLDSEGRSFKPVDKYMVFSPFDEIGPGMTQTTAIGFDVPDTAKGFSLIVGKDADLYSVNLGI